MEISRAQLEIFESTLTSVAHTLPKHVRYGIVDILAVQIQGTVGQTIMVAAESIVRQNQGTFDSYLDELTAAGVSGQQLVMMFLTVGLNSGDWRQTLNLFKNA